VDPPYTTGLETPTVALDLRGSGFQVDRPEENVVWIDGTRTAISWGVCSTQWLDSSPSAPTELRIRGEVLNTEHVRLCSVPVPSNGQLRIAIGFGDTPSETRLFRVFSMTAVEVAIIAAVIASALALLPIAMLSLVKRPYSIAGQPYKLRMLFLDPETDTYSLSKLQFYLWTIAALFAYAYLFISRVKVQLSTWPDIPTTLPGIIAVAGGTAIGAQVITSMKGSKGAGAESPSIADFITSGGVVGIDRLQMLLWTLFGVGAFFAVVLEQGPGTITELPPVPEGLLYLMGISSVGYLGGKMARKAGPVINEIAVTPPEPDDAITQRAIPSLAEHPNLVEALVVAGNEAGSLQPGANAHAQAALDALTEAIAAARSANTVKQFDQLITDLGKFRTATETAATKAAEDFSAGRAKAEEAQAAQKAAAVLQDFSADVTQALSQAAAESMQAVTARPQIVRVIELRGTNLSADAFFDIDHVDLPFRMLTNSEQKQAPDIIVREPAAPTLARVMKLVIDPGKLGTPDLDQFQRWFGTTGRRSFTITNPDGQKAELSFDLPPGATQKAEPK